ncbi:P-loop containing nucleoside triphosphate hydrolase protein [Microstroma glucosiphilum]|uniref:Guanine nucleotide-binding protein-like 1 n=1 Tax=Pseudomicrostroma glucosiphilum TaxID=1684307 RepID=A0A316U2I8_9BASI|nr:P-loop containing nucleoside triphosphate hydrolase protein [Pseudomicrostroma glucosiphilum]PWN19400.1 P-loop containing nucleoside triphosphate hydrolase protein [Pseudomicrostroma glucosiphilum]
MAKKKKKPSRRNQGDDDVNSRDAVATASAPETSGTASATTSRVPNGATANKARALESRFAKLIPTALENLSLIAAYTPLERPVRPELAILTPERIDASTSAYASASSAEGGSKGGRGAFRLPKKPRWHRDLSAKAVQSNESSVFSSWLEETDAAMDSRFSLVRGLLSSQLAEVKHLPQPKAEECLLPSMFERNVEVYRQLWRVMERSHLLLVLLDARCPLLHLPPSLVEHLRKYAAVKTILVLTKKDIVGEDVTMLWKRWLEEKFGWSVVVTEAYKRQEKREGQGKRTRLTPFLSDDSRSAIFAAIKKAHKSLITPPAKVAEDPERLAQWQPSCAVNIDWDEVQSGRHVLRNGGDNVAGSSGRSERDPSETSLCIGLIGQPNVGKSSLLNALMGSKVVHASRTPGKTKIFQTHYLGGAGAAPSVESSPQEGHTGTTNSHNNSDGKSRVLLCDCPGLVFPSSAGQELQVLGAILPISQVQSTASILRFAASHIPLERVLALQMPEDEYGDASVGGLVGERQWTATLLLEALCRRHGYKTAKAGRWDVNRAGNALIRALAEGRIRWAFHPPPLTSSPSDNDTSQGDGVAEAIADDYHYDGRGIWLPGSLTDPSSSSSSSATGATHDPSSSSVPSYLDEDGTDEDDNDDDASDAGSNIDGQGRDLEGASHPLLRKKRARGKSSKRVTFEEEEEEAEEESSEIDAEGQSEEEEEVVEQAKPIGRAASLFEALAVEGQDEEEEEEKQEESDDTGRSGSGSDSDEREGDTAAK